MTGHYVWVDGKPYPNTWADQAGHDYVQALDQLVVETEAGRGYVRRVEPGEYSVQTRPWFVPYVILRDGSREVLEDDPNYSGAIARLTHRLGATPT